jgi:hypothetical protein
LSRVCPDACGNGQNGSRAAAALGAADWLYLAATPTFAMMALLTWILDGGSRDAFCSGASTFGGMVTMYVLMSAFHMTHWLQLFTGRQVRTRRY